MFSHAASVGLVLSSALQVNGQAEPPVELIGTARDTQEGTGPHLEWVLGDAGDDCNVACNRKGMYCNALRWPFSTLQMMQVASATGVTCKEYIGKSEPAWAPFVQESVAAGMCVFNIDRQLPSCGAEPIPVTGRRICPCGLDAPGFFLAKNEESCDDFCEARGGVCSKDQQARALVSSDLLRAHAAALGQACSGTPSVGQMTEMFHPSIRGDICFRPMEDTTTSCAAKAPRGHRRICMCNGASSSSRTTGSDEEHDNSRLRMPGKCASGGEFVIGQAFGEQMVSTMVGHRVTSAVECFDLVKSSCPNANGAGLIAATGECSCKEGMTGYNIKDGHQVCWFSSARITANPGMLGGYWSKTPVVTSASTSSMYVALAAVSGATIAAVLVQRNWRQSRRAPSPQVVESEEKFLEE